MEQPTEVVITNLDMPFWSMVKLMIKIALAAIPATLILTAIAWFIVFTVMIFGATMLGGH